MICGIGKGRTEPCYDNIGGLKNIYLFTFVNYRNYHIQTNGSNLISYPSTDIYKYELRADSNTFSTDVSNDEDGQSYNQNASFVLKGLRNDYVEINNLLNKRIGVIIETRLGHFQIMGLYNGVTVKSVKGSSGGGRSDFRGFNISLSAKEKKEPLFIDDLQNAGFNIVLPTIQHYLLQENGSYLLQENNFKILLDPVQPLQLVAQYDFNNNLIDSIGGNNGTGTNITFNNGSAVFSGIPSKVLINNLGAFDFTDGVNDLPFRIETSVILNSLPSGSSDPSTYILGKRDNTSTLQNYQLIVRQNGFDFALLSNNPTAGIGVNNRFSQNLSLNTVYDITITYDGSKTLSGLKMVVNGVEQVGNEDFGTIYTAQEYTGANVYLGIAGFGIPASRFYLDGKMDYLKIYK